MPFPFPFPLPSPLRSSLVGTTISPPPSLRLVHCLLSPYLLPSQHHVQPSLLLLLQIKIHTGKEIRNQVADMLTRDPEIQRSKSLSAMGRNAGDSIKSWWEWSFGWILSKKPVFAQDLEMNEGFGFQQQEKLEAHHVQG
ncbi:hypothetical protein LINPERHAP2_LOCUS25182 [Linum perenne]